MFGHARYGIFVICSVWSLLVSEIALSRPLTIGFGWLDKKPLWPKLQDYLSLICQTAERNLQCELRFVPFARLQDLVIYGEIDGDLARARDGYDGKPSVVRVDEPLATLQFYFVSNKNRVLEDLDSVRQYKTAVDLGSKLQKKMCEDLNLNCEFVGPGSSSLKMLKLQRVGTVLVSQLQTSDLSEFGNPELFNVSRKSFYESPVYLFIGKKHEDLARKLSEAIRENKRNGSYKKIFNVDP